jgi:hypothetical protein
MNKKHKQEFMDIVNRECKKDGKGRFKTIDVLRVAQRTYSEQKEIIAAYRAELAKYQRQK